jgi:hypothetical protein
MPELVQYVVNTPKGRDNIDVSLPAVISLTVQSSLREILPTL